MGLHPLILQLPLGPLQSCSVFFQPSLALVLLISQCSGESTPRLGRAFPRKVLEELLPLNLYHCPGYQSSVDLGGRSWMAEGHRAAQGEHRDLVCSCRDAAWRARTQLETEPVRDAENSKKAFSKCASSKRKAKKNVDKLIRGNRT